MHAALRFRFAILATLLPVCAYAQSPEQATRQPTFSSSLAARAAGPAFPSAIPVRADMLRPARDLAGSVADLARDLWMTVSAPAWMSGDDWLLTAGIVGVGALMYTVDEDLTRAAIRNEDEPVFDQVLDVGTFLEPLGLMGKTNAWLALGAVGSYFAGFDRPKRIFTELLYSQWIAGLFRAGSNRLVGRARPHRELGARHFEFNDGTSFPSGHASTIFQVATVLAYHADWLPASIVLYGLAGTVAWQRIADEQHWASDVWLGAASGWAIAKLVVRLHEDEALTVAPITGPAGGVGLEVRVRF
jgi:membrane-associated phospholipid phosphatase